MHAFYTARIARKDRRFCHTGPFPAGIRLATPSDPSERKPMNASVERVRDALAELIKAALISDDATSLASRDAGRAKLAALVGDPPDPASLRMDGAWTLAIQEAETPELAPQEGQVNLTLPRACPFTLAEIVSPGFDVDQAVDHIRKIASTG
jgi:hypothetical protein